jgi:hypothetical protein
MPILLLLLMNPLKLLKQPNGVEKAASNDTR